MSNSPSITMRLCRQVFTVAIILLATPSVAECKRQKPTTDICVLISVKSSTLRIAGRDFACRAVAFFHSEQGRANFTIALDDPADNSHVISFSGETSRREQ